MSHTITLIPPGELSEAWHYAGPLLTPAIERSGGRYDAASVYKILEKAQGRLWLVFNANFKVCAAFTTHIARYPKKDMLSVGFLGGESLSDWLGDVTETLDRYVIAHRLSGVECFGRAGWERPLKKFGWHRTNNRFEKMQPASGAV